MKLRRAELADLNEVLCLIREDSLASQREASETSVYETVWCTLLKESYVQCWVGLLDNQIIAFAQLYLLDCLSHQAARRGQLENVRIAKAYRGKGWGHFFIQAIEKQAILQGCRMMQLTSNQLRTRAHHFYQQIGYTASHLGFKKDLVNE